MNTLFTNSLTKTILYGGLLFIFSCNNNKAGDDNHANENPKEQAEDMNEEKFNREGEKDADRMVEAYLTNLYEIRASENAASRATTADVKKLAAMFGTAHTKMGADIQALAGRKNITLPTDLTDDQRDKLEKLAQKDGLDYDKEYAAQMRERHEEAIKLCERTADKGEDAEIKQWASASLPDLRSHLEMVNATHDKLKDMKDDDKKTKDKNTWDNKSDMHDGRDDIHDRKH